MHNTYVYLVDLVNLNSAYRMNLNSPEKEQNEFQW